MTETPTKLIVDCSTGEQTIVPLTAEEITFMQEESIKRAEEAAAAQAEAEAKAAAKATAAEKLAALGLTLEEIAALTK